MNRGTACVLADSGARNIFAGFLARLSTLFAARGWPEEWPERGNSKYAYCFAPDELMGFVFFVIAFLTFASAVAAMSLPNLVHCALCLALTFLGIATLFLQLNAQFVGLAQILVYVGAVAILIVFAILLTRAGEARGWKSVVVSTWILGLLIGGGVATALIWAVRSIPMTPPQGVVSVSVEQIGKGLMSEYVLPLEVLGLLLTSALIGAVVIALKENERPAKA